jgi:hypothetical protein
MNSKNFLFATVVLASFVAGPVLAQTETPATGGSTGSSMSSDQGTTNSGATKGKRHKHHKHHKKSGSGGVTSPTTTGE